MSKPSRTGEIVLYGLIAGSVWLGWEIVKASLTNRAPPAISVRVAPTSPEALRRAAEAELTAGRIENAVPLAREALSRAPFDARSLRVLGLATARAGDINRADEMLTLAGNWSLRDDPTHAWLVERRLRQGSFTSAFAHADTLARRREDLRPGVFNLFTTAALHDSRALGPVVTTISRDPPWRQQYLYYLVRRADADPVLAGVALALDRTSRPLSNDELGDIYENWFAEGRIQAVRYVSEKLNRPNLGKAIQDGDFATDQTSEVRPFAWRLPTQHGISGAMIEDDIRHGESALRVEYDGYASGIAAEQVTMLKPGDHRISGQYRVESSPDDSRLRWSLTCFESGVVVGQWQVPPVSRSPERWASFQMRVQVPDQGCVAQRIRLSAIPGDRRDFTVAWFDKMRGEAVRR